MSSLLLERPSQLTDHEPVELGGLALAVAPESPDAEELWWKDLANNVAESGYAKKMGVGNIEEYLALHAREQSFARKAYTTALEMAEGNDKPVVLLFDVDHTISDISDADAHNERVIRPAFPFVIALLREKLGDRLRVGLLSTLKTDAVAEQCLADIDPEIIDKDLIIGTRQYAAAHPYLKLDEISKSKVNEKRVRKGLRDILDPYVYAAICTGKLDLKDVRDVEGKLEILLDLARQHPDYNIALIDNNCPTGMIRCKPTSLSHPRIWGVHVGPEMQDDIHAWNRYELFKRLAKVGLSGLAGTSEIAAATESPSARLKARQRLRSNK